MSVPLEYVDKIATALVSIGGAAMLTQWRLKQAERENEKQWEYLHEVRDWQADHVQESLNKRIDYEKRFGEIVTSMGKVEIQYIEAEKRTKQIEGKIDDLSRKLDRLMEIVAKK